MRSTDRCWTEDKETREEDLESFADDKETADCLRSAEEHKDGMEEEDTEVACRAELSWEEAQDEDGVS